MSVTSVTASRERSASDTAQGITYYRKYLVETDSADTTEKDILAHDDIPKLYEKLDEDSSVTCKRRNPEQDRDNLLEWIVTCEYRTRQGNEASAGEEIAKPTDEDPRITFGFTRYVIAVDKSYKMTGDAPAENRGSQSIPVRNSAGDEFDPPVTEEKTNLLITIQRNEKTKEFDLKTSYDYVGTVNSKKITIAGVKFDPWTGLMRNIGMTKAWDFNGDAYYQIVYEIEGDQDTFVRKVLDQGYYATIDDIRKKIQGSDIVPNPDTVNPDEFVSEPQKLDLAGGLFTPTADEKAKYLDFYTKWACSWSGLSLPKDY